VSLVSTIQNQVFQNAFRVKSLQVLGFQTRRVEARYIVAFSGEWVSDSMDQVNLESSDLKGHTSIDV